MTIGTDLEAVVPEVRAAAWGWKLALGLAALALVAAVVWWLFIRPGVDHRAATRATVAAKAADVAVGTAKAAANTVETFHDTTRIIETTTEKNHAAIMAAPGAAAPVDPAAARAALAALCVRDVYRGRPPCA